MLTSKFDELKRILLDMNSVLVAYSGGVDSTFLLSVAKKVLKNNVLAVTARSETYPLREYEQALSIVKQLKIKHMTIVTQELGIPEFASNPIDRCYLCKKELFARLRELANKNGISHLADGSNADDIHDFRPGLRALEEMGVRSPLKEAGLTKDEIRSLSRRMKLTTWDKPAFACLSSRFPYGTEITTGNLKMVEEAENFLYQLGFKQVRVRHHGSIARIEIGPDQLGDILLDDRRKRISEEFKKIGYKYITLDIEGYRTGSMNEVILS